MQSNKMNKNKSNQKSEKKVNHLSRRDFVKITGITALGLTSCGISKLNLTGISLILNPGEGIAGSGPVQWAAGEFVKSCDLQGIKVSRFEQPDKGRDDDLNVIVAGSDSPIAAQLSDSLKIKMPMAAEALGLIPLNRGNKKTLMAYGHDERGLVYALLELADRLNFSSNAFESLNIREPLIEKPANSVRSLQRLFVSNVEDKPWFNDKKMWPEYLTMIATQRYNRFNLSLGIGYDWLNNVLDSYFLFAYPFLLSVPGYDVKIPQLPDAERDNNLNMLRFISDETASRGIDFQLGIWMHGYKWLNSPNANYTIEGLNAGNHAEYCRDALRALLIACPSISGITFRIHAESGISEGSYGFWGTVFDGVATCGRKVRIDMHAKGIDQKLIDVALAKGMPVSVSPKYWAEHMGLPYHQADIRALEIPKENINNSNLSINSVSTSLSSGSRSFMRYGYGDLLKEDRKYEVVYRIWPGTQRLLVWGDPLTAAAHGRNFSFCGSSGVEIMEPLSFKGRRGSGIAGSRCAYADTDLIPEWDWEKYLYTLRVFGRKIYNPEAEPDTWQRYLKNRYRSGTDSVESALSSATRILPVVLTAHGTSAGNNTYWPEMYANQPIVISNRRNDRHYGDTPSPKVFGNVSPMDPQLFMGINEFVKEALKEDRSGKYTPVEYAQWIEDYADDALKYLKMAGRQSKDKNKPEYKRMYTDVLMLAGLGHFFGAKFRAGVLYGIYEQTGDRSALEEALNLYRKARSYWSELAESARNIYVPDITFGGEPWLRGHWLDRLADMDEDIENMSKKLEDLKESGIENEVVVKKVVREALGRPERTPVVCEHNKPDKLINGQPLNLMFAFKKKPLSAVLFYRHVNQAERYKKMDLSFLGNDGRASIPGDYTDSPYPIAYYLEVKNDGNSAVLYPGFNASLTNQPYFTVQHV